MKARCPQRPWRTSEGSQEIVSTSSGPLTATNAVSLARSLIDRPQHVSVTMNGFAYPGEVIFADQWQDWFGSGLPERVMFRLVLLSGYHRVDAAGIAGRLIAVAMPSEHEAAGGPQEYAQLDREIGRLNEIRERYITSSDTELRALTSSLSGQASEAERGIAGALSNRWRRGRVVISGDGGGENIPGDAVFVGADPGAWTEAIAAALFTRSEVQAAQAGAFSAEQLFDRIVRDPDTKWRDDLDGRVRLAGGIGLEELLDDMDGLAGGDRDEVNGTRLRDLLVRQHGLPPGLTLLVLTAYIRSRDGQASIAEGPSFEFPRLDMHTLANASYDPDLIYSVLWLSDHRVSDWDSALPYIVVLLPHAAAAGQSEPDPALEQQVARAIQVMQSRVALTLSALESAMGPAYESLRGVADAIRLARVLEANSWSQLYENGTRTFPSVAAFEAAVSEASRLRNLSEDAVDVQAAHDYISAADFGRLDQGLAADATSLTAMLNIGEMLAQSTSAAPVLQEFGRWKRSYIRSYTAHHAERRSIDLERVRRVRRADRQHSAVQKLVSIPELRNIYTAGFESGWNELKSRVRPCSNREHELELQSHPYCRDCGVRMGSPDHEDELEERISEIEEMLNRCSVRLSEMAVSRVLSGQREDELRKLTQINALSDLTSVSRVLDDGLLSFLERFATPSSGTSQDDA